MSTNESLDNTNIAEINLNNLPIGATGTIFYTPSTYVTGYASPYTPSPSVTGYASPNTLAPSVTGYASPNTPAPSVTGYSGPNAPSTYITGYASPNTPSPSVTGYANANTPSPSVTGYSGPNTPSTYITGYSGPNAPYTYVTSYANPNAPYTYVTSYNANTPSTYVTGYSGGNYTFTPPSFTGPIGINTNTVFPSGLSGPSGPIQIDREILNVGIKTIPPNSEDAITFEEIMDGDILINFNRDSNKTEYDYGAYYKESTLKFILKTRKNQFTMKPIDIDSIVKYVAKLE